MNKKEFKILQPHQELMAMIASFPEGAKLRTTVDHRGTGFWATKGDECYFYSGNGVWTSGKDLDAMRN